VDGSAYGLTRPNLKPYLNHHLYGVAGMGPSGHVAVSANMAMTTATRIWTLVERWGRQRMEHRAQPKRETDPTTRRSSGGRTKRRVGPPVATVAPTTGSDAGGEGGTAAHGASCPAPALDVTTPRRNSGGRTGRPVMSVVPVASGTGSRTKNAGGEVHRLFTHACQARPTSTRTPTPPAGNASLRCAR